MPKTGVESIRKAAVINAALICISDNGISRVTLDMVAVQAGCSKGVVTYYFKSKQELVLECLKAFFSYYSVKTAGGIAEGMTSASMLEEVLRHALPPLDTEEEPQALNVNPADGPQAMHIPAESKARLFIQFFSLAATDPAAQEAISRIYGKDAEGIARLFRHGMNSGELPAGQPWDQAYGLLAIIVGLSVFRVIGFMPPEDADNRHAALHYLSGMMRNGRD
ncbi:MAG: transcriptional regulator [Paenibacillaceae bacterium]|jgi:TetR/AcrR family transcriptional repressor of bet genes|nr:transcriptional regulator [Paenibacillaceae bacterium]